MIRNVELTDAYEIGRIYNEYVLNSTITFEEEALANEEIISRIKYVFES